VSLRPKNGQYDGDYPRNIIRLDAPEIARVQINVKSFTTKPRSSPSSAMSTPSMLIPRTGQDCTPCRPKENAAPEVVSYISVDRYVNHMPITSDAKN